MTDSKQAQSIANKSRRVQKHFLNLTSFLDEIPADGSLPALTLAIRDALGRFNLWAGNLGALQKPGARLSLDYRLSQAAEIHAEICVQLDEIVEAIEDFKAVILSSRLKSGGEFNLEVGFGRLVLEPKGQPDIPALGEPANEAQMMLEIISESIKSLIRIGMIVRSSTSCDRFKKALHTLGPIFCDGPDINHVKEKYPKIQDDRLLARLGNANAKRRRVIAYYRDHTSRLGGHFDDNNPDQLSSKATTFAADNFAQVQAKFDRGDSESASSTTVSTEFSASLNPDLPRLVELSNREESFKCPICQTIQTFKREKSWRTHAFRDLYAYVCTAGEAGCEDQIFGDRESWFAHELKHHRAKYKCALCADGSFSPKDLRHHFQEIHRIPDEEQLQALQDMSQLNSSAFNARDCPFCDDWADALCSRKDPKGKGNESSQNHTGILVSNGRFRRHVATHLEYLSIFALPRATEEKGADESESPIESLSDTTSQSEADLDLIQQQKHSQSLDPAPKPEEAVKFATTTTKKPEEDQVHNVLPKYSTEQATTKPIVKTGMVRGPSTTAMGRGAKSIVETWACDYCQYVEMTKTDLACTNCGHWRCSSCVTKRHSRAQH